jgi:DNA-binding SARP family transcriptional activator/Flp pilus assembly protein TadD
MGDRLEFSLLGPLRVDRDGTPVPVPPGRQRALLAALLLNGGRVMPADELIEVLWGSLRPASARVTLHNYVKRLRQALGDSGHARILTQSPGYLISVIPDELDVSRFEVLLRAARVATRAGEWEQAASQAHAALSLWRGEPLTDVESEVLTWREVPRLAELRLAALEIRLDADLRLGGHAEVIEELRQLVRAHPLREQSHALLMLALYRCGRQAEALAVYADARRVLIEELGTEPGAELREMQQRILSADPALTVLPVPVPEPPAPPVALSRAPVVPRALPNAVSRFAGREDELATLTGLLEQAPGQTPEQAPGTVVISAIGGTAGVGKTALAVHWAHQVAERFPDGQLYLNLRGYDPGQPMSPDAALATFLQVLGVPGPEIPADADERAVRYRSLLAGRRMLVLLDNAGSVDQVRPLLPASAGCMALVTSRDSLAGLVARDGAQRLDLDLLPLADATGLLRALIGERATADAGATLALAGQCSRLPLALRVAAERATERPGTSLAGLVAELADEQRRLDLLDAGGDARTAVRAVFSWSYRHLDPAAARAFRLAALHPGDDLDVYAAAALTGTTLEQASDLLSQLARAYLIQPVGPPGLGRYALHDLLRAYARELAAARDADDEGHAALTRLFDYYLHTAATAADTLYPADHHRRPHIPLPGSPVPPVTNAEAAQAWLDAERPSLVMVAAHTAANGWPGHATRLAVTLFRYLDTGGHFAEALTIHDFALRGAGEIGDRGAEAEALISLGTVDLRQGRFRMAGDRLERSLVMFRAIGDKSGQSRALHNLGIIGLLQGAYPRAIDHLERAAALCHEAGDPYGEARALGNLGVIAVQQGRYQQAAGYHRQILAMFRATGDRSGEAHGLISLGNLERRLGHDELAGGYLEQGLVMFRAIGDRSGEGYALTDLGDVDLRRGHYGRAIGHHEQALSLFGETGNPGGQAKALNGLGEAFLEAGRVDEACLRHTDALRLASQIDDKYEQARAHDSLGRGCQILGDPSQGRRHWEQALALYVRLGAPEADRIRAQLDPATPTRS